MTYGETVYDLGDEAVVDTIITNNEGALVTPGTITLRFQKPDGTTDDVTPANPSLGAYSGVYILDQPGRWYFKWTTTGPVGVDNGTFWVNPSPVV